MNDGRVYERSPQPSERRLPAACSRHEAGRVEPAPARSRQLQERLTIVVADDEPLAVDRVSRLLGRCGSVELLQSASSGREAVDAVAELKPDLLLLDIEMPHVDGFSVIQSLSQRFPDPRRRPLVVLLTAHPAFALQAFDNGVLDFLCKPVRLARLQQTLDRARRALTSSEPESDPVPVDPAPGLLREGTAYVEEQGLWFRDKARIVHLAIEDVDWVEAEGPYSRLHAGGSSYLLRNPIRAFADQLASGGCIQIHRSAIVNRRKISRIETARGGARLALQCGVELPIGRKFKLAVMKLARSDAAIRTSG